MDRPRLAPLALLAAAALVTLLSACSNDTPDTPATVTVTVGPDGESAGPDAPTDSATTPAATPGADESPLPDEGPVDDAPFAANTEPDTGAASAGALLSPTNLCFGVHDGFDRLVLDLSGDGDPGWLAEYVDTPTGQASGEVVDLEGDASLVLTIQGMLLPTEPGAVPYTGPQTITPSGDGVIREIVYGSLFEGTLQVFVGVASKEPFRVYLLQDPTRLVLDVQHP